MRSSLATRHNDRLQSHFVDLRQQTLVELLIHDSGTVGEELVAPLRQVKARSLQRLLDILFVRDQIDHRANRSLVQSHAYRRISGNRLATLHHDDGHCQYKPVLLFIPFPERRRCAS